MIRTQPSFAVVSALLAACAASPDAEPPSSASMAEADSTGRQLLTIAPAIGATTTATVLVSGSDRTVTSLPSPIESPCGGALRVARSFRGEAYAYFEVTNPTDEAATVSLFLDAPNITKARPALYVYASDMPPTTDEETMRCMVADAADWDARGKAMAPPALAQEDGTAVVVDARSSVYVLLATEERTGPYTVTARTDSLTTARPLVIPSSPGVEETATVLVSGRERTTMTLPAPSSTSCGGRLSVARSYEGESYAYVEIQNPAEEAAVVSLSVSHPNISKMEPALFAYATANPPATEEEVMKCMVAVDAEWSSTVGAMVPPRLSVEDGTALVVGARSSAYVLLATRGRTGAFTLTIERE